MLIDGTKRKEDENTMIGGAPQSNLSGSMSTNMGQTGSKGPTASGGFTNLNKYLQANQGANNQTINKLNTTANASAKEAQDAINSAKGVGMSAQQNLDKYKQDQEFVQGALDDPLKNPNLAKFNELRTSFDANPSGQLSQFDQATATANATRGAKANELQNYTTQGGLTDWLRTQRTSPRYSQGSQSLDRFLLQGTPEGSQALQGIGQKATELGAEPSDFADIRSGIQSKAQALDPNFMNSAQIQNATNTKIQAERKALMDYQNQQAQMGPDMTAGTGGNELGKGGMPGLIDRGGAAGATGQANAMDEYMRANDTGALINRFSPEQIARYTALAQMAGEEPTDILSQNERLYQNRLRETNRVKEQYLAKNESERSAAMAQAQAQAQAEADRQKQLQQLLAIFAGAQGAPSSGVGWY